MEKILILKSVYSLLNVPLQAFLCKSGLVRVLLYFKTNGEVFEWL